MAKVKVYAVLHHGGNLYIPVKAEYGPHSYFNRRNCSKAPEYAYCSQLPNCFGGTVEGADSCSTPEDDLRTLLTELDEESQGNIMLTNPRIELLISDRNIEGSIYKVYVMSADELTIARPFEMPTYGDEPIPLCNEAYTMMLDPYDNTVALRTAKNGAAALHNYLSRYENKCIIRISATTFTKSGLPLTADGIIQICILLRVTPDEVAPQVHLATFDKSIYKEAYDLFFKRSSADLSAFLS